jgi:hypothetical protein
MYEMIKLIEIDIKYYNKKYKIKNNKNLEIFDDISIKNGKKFKRN